MSDSTTAFISDDVMASDSLQYVRFYELLEGRPPENFEAFNEKARQFEYHINCGRAVLLGLLAVADHVLAVVICAEALSQCADDSSLTWNASLSALNLIFVLVPLAIAVCSFNHALFTDHPLLFLLYSVYAFVTDFRAGLRAACAKVFRERNSRAQDVPSFALCRIVTGFFTSNRLAMMVALVIKFHRHALPSLWVVLDTLIVGSNYVRLFYNQMQYCDEARDPKKGRIFGFLSSWCVRGNAQICVLPVVMSVLIWQNMNGDISYWLCPKKAPEEE